MDRSGLSWLPVISGGSDEPHKYDDVVVSFSDTVFGFWEDASENSSNSQDVDDDNMDEDELSNKHFWEQQHQLLQASLCKTSSFETKIRQATKEGLRELINRSDMQYCICRRRVVAAAKGCRSCLQREICNHLLSLGYDCVICISKWRSSSKIPSGEHTYLEAIDKSNTKRGEIKVIIELNFQAEFQMARANEQYNQLISRLPQVYVGKLERLQVLIKILCSAQCMKENNMHLGPWRKLKYVQAKWLGTCDKSTRPARPLPTGSYSVRQQPRPKASMLTCDLLDNIPGLHCTAVEVV